VLDIDHGFLRARSLACGVLSRTALLIGVINDMEFEGAEALVAQAVPMARRVAELKRRARDAGIPAIYVTDNFGRWKSDFRRVVAHCLEAGVRGQDVVRILQPDDYDYFVLKRNTPLSSPRPPTRSSPTSAHRRRSPPASRETSASSSARTVRTCATSM
jgi:hypothetical protein